MKHGDKLPVIHQNLLALFSLLSLLPCRYIDERLADIAQEDADADIRVGQQHEQAGGPAEAE